MGQTMSKNRTHDARGDTRDTAPVAPLDAPPAPLSRPVAVTRLSRRQPTPFEIEADAAELAALASFLDVPRVDRLSFEGEIAPMGDEGWEVRGRLIAELEQTCVVSLDPVPVRHDAEVQRLYLPEDRLPPVREVTLDPDEPDEPDAYTTTIDPAALAVESLALMLDPYPRAAGAEPGPTTATPPGAAPIEEEELNPFAGLAELKRRLERGGK